MMFWLTALLWAVLTVSPVLQQTPPPTIPTEETDSRGVIMIRLPGGTFIAGIKPDHASLLCQQISGPARWCEPEALTRFGSINYTESATVEPFLLDKYAVSLESYFECIQEDVCTSWSIEQLWDLWLYDPKLDLGLPVYEVKYPDARVYCAWRGARLPTELEWEYAARTFETDTTASRIIPFTPSDINPILIGAYFPVNSAASIQSWAGAYNMVGNVGEWTSSRIFDLESLFFGALIVKGLASHPLYSMPWARLPAGDETSSNATGVGIRCARSIPSP